MAVADKSVVDFHGKERVPRYVMALMNVVCISVNKVDGILNTCIYQCK